MDSTISTSEAAGPAQRAASVPLRSPPVVPPEKVPPVSEGNRSHSSSQDEAGLPEKVNRNPEPQDRKAETGGPAKTQAPPYSVELQPGEAEDSGKVRLTGSSQDAPPSPFKSEADKGREALPLPGDSSAPAPHEVLAEALAAAKALWAEVNQEALEANTLRTYSTADVEFSSKALGPTAPTGKDSSDVEMSNGLQRQLTIRYENLATSLSNPHPTKPVIDLFV